MEWRINMKYIWLPNPSWTICSDSFSLSKSYFIFFFFLQIPFFPIVVNFELLFYSKHGAYVQINEKEGAANTLATKFLCFRK